MTERHAGIEDARYDAKRARGEAWTLLEAARKAAERLVGEDAA
jgi:hypothetical protein